MNSKINIQQQVAYCSVMKLELAGGQNEPECETQHSINSNPIATGLLLIRKTPDVYFSNKIGKIFKGHNLFEYRFPGDRIGIKAFLKAVGYACLYLAYTNDAEKIRDNDITISLVSKEKPKKLFRQLARRGLAIRKDGKGIYQIQGLHFFTVQVIVSSELNENEHIWLKSLAMAMENENAERLILTIGD